jgi:hypothetical protein
LQTPEKKKQISISSILIQEIKLPYFDERYNLKSFDSIRLKISNIDKTVMNCILTASYRQLKINHPKFARKDVLIKNARFDYKLLLGTDFLSVDSSSTLNLNKIKFKTYAKYDTNSDTIYSLKVLIPK